MTRLAQVKAERDAYKTRAWHFERMLMAQLNGSIERVDCLDYAVLMCGLDQADGGSVVICYRDRNVNHHLDLCEVGYFEEVRSSYQHNVLGLDGAQSYVLEALNDAALALYRRRRATA